MLGIDGNEFRSNLGYIAICAEVLQSVGRLISRPTGTFFSHQSTDQSTDGLVLFFSVSQSTGQSTGELRLCCLSLISRHMSRLTSSVDTSVD